MPQRTVTVVLAVALAISIAALARAWRLPGNNRGYEPAQPIAFSHRQHAGDLRISCFYCHASAASSRYAGIPTPGLCMNCHEQVTAPSVLVEQERETAKLESRPPQRVVSPELRKLYDALALDAELQPLDARAPEPVAWVRVHALPDFVYFDHRAHVSAGVSCQSCHGPVESMDRIRQVETLSMGWCVNCHREVNETGVNGRSVSASIDCMACHF